MNLAVFYLSLGWTVGGISSQRVVMHWYCCPGSFGVTIPGNVQEMCGHGTEGCGLQGMVGMA